jgi:hypothetical protein
MLPGRAHRSDVRLVNVADKIWRGEASRCRKGEANWRFHDLDARAVIALDEAREMPPGMSAPRRFTKQ